MSTTILKNFNSYEIIKNSNEYREYSLIFDFKGNFLFETDIIIVVLENIVDKFYVKNKKSNKIYSICKKDISAIMFNTKKILSSVIFEKFIENNFIIKNTIKSLK